MFPRAAVSADGIGVGLIEFRFILFPPLFGPARLGLITLYPIVAKNIATIGDCSTTIFCRSTRIIFDITHGQMILVGII